MKLCNLSLTLLAFGMACGSFASAEECDKSNGQDYPTAAKVDYVIGCMASNGQTHEMLQKCSCSIDRIAKAIPYEEYVQISTLMSLQQMAGAGRNAVYKNATWSTQAVARLREVQADSTLSCF
jgi:hypothetical protein